MALNKQIEKYFVRKLRSVVYHEDEARRWMMLPHPLLDGRRPIDCEPKEIFKVLQQLRDGAYT